MHTLQSFGLLCLALLSGTALGKVHDVDVGKSGFTFSPSTVTAAVGDHVNFHFYGGDHSVSQSLFIAPCQPSGPKAIFSGFINPTDYSQQASKMFSMRVNSTAPIWLYCSQVEHCQLGMAMVINPPA